LYYFAYTFIEYLAFTFLIYQKIQSPIFRKIILILSICFIAFQFFHYFTIKLKVVDSLPIGVETILIFAYIIFYFYEQFKQPNPVELYRNETFWITVAIMIYLGGSFFFNILAPYLNPRMVLKYWFLTWVGDIIKNAIFLYALFAIKKTTKNQQPQKKSIPHLDMDFTL
jgi:hypothetical protein